VERTRYVDIGEVLVEMTHHLVVVATGRENVDEPEELRLEVAVGHGPLEHPLAPPGRVEDPGPFAVASVGDATGDCLHLAFEARGHHRRGYRPRVTPPRLLGRAAIYVWPRP